MEHGASRGVNLEKKYPSLRCKQLLKDSRSTGGGRLEAVKSELRAPGKPNFTKPYCGKRGSAAMDRIIPSYPWDSDEGTEQSKKPKKHK